MTYTRQQSMDDFNEAEDRRMNVMEVRKILGKFPHIDYHDAMSLVEYGWTLGNIEASVMDHLQSLIDGSKWP